MALSGSFSKDVSAHWRVRCTWSGTQNISGNYTDITLKTYWESTDSYGTTYTSDSKSGSSTINGSKDSFSFSAKLTGKQSKLVNTQTVRVNHNNDGKKSVSLSASLGIELTLNGTYYGTVTASTTVTLNTIPRASTLSSSASWTAGNNLSISISRASSSFTHNVEISVNGTVIKTLNGIGTSTTVSFSQAENTKIFQQLNGGASKGTSIKVTTLNGGSTIGTSTKTGTVSSPSASTISSSVNFNIGANVSFSISRANSGFTHTLQIYVGGTLIKTISNVTTSTTWSPTSTETNNMYNKTPNSNTVGTEVRCTTYYNGVIVRSYTSKTGTATVTNSNPTFSPSSISYKDVDSKMVGITGNDQMIVQNLSSLTAFVNSKATAINGATFKQYVVTINGQEKTISGETGSVNVGKITAGTNQVLSIKAVDSRGNSTTVTKTVTIVPYTPPTIVSKVQRLNNFEETTKIDISGTYSPLTINGANKNVLKSVVYRFKKKSDQYFNNEVTVSYTTSGTSFSAKTNTSLNNTSAYDFEIEVTDSFNTVTVTNSVGQGQPIFFIDSKKRSIGLNDFPANPNEFRLNGRLVFGANTYASNGGGESDSGGAMDMNNSDIVRANGIYFNDIADNNGEGLLFLKSGKPNGSNSSADYHNFRVDKDGNMLLNGKTVLHEGDVQIQTGYSSITPVANSPTSVDIKFPKAFSGTPRVILTPNTTVPGTRVQGWGATSVTSTGFTLYIYRTDTTSTGFYWIAIYGGSR